MSVDKIWIELERPCSKIQGDARAKLASAILAKLGVRADSIWWHDTRNVYCYTDSDDGTFLELSDNGHWFNMRALAA